MRKLLTVSISAVVVLLVLGSARADEVFNSVTYYSKMSVSSGRYINLNYSPTGKTIVRAKYAASTTGNNCLYCARNGTSASASEPVFCFFPSVDKKFRFDYYAKTYPGGVGSVANDVYELEVKNGTATVTDVTKGTTDTASRQEGVADFDAKYPLYLLASYTSGATTPGGWGNYFQGDFYYLRIYEIEDGVEVLKREFIPCKTADGKTGLAERVEESVYFEKNGNSFGVKDEDVIVFGPTIENGSFKRTGVRTYSVRVAMKDACTSVRVQAIPMSGEMVEVLGGAVAEGESVTLELADLPAGHTYNIKVVAHNDKGDTTATLGDVYTGSFTVAKGSDGSEETLAPATFVISRGTSPEDMALELLVRYAVSGEEGTFVRPIGVVALPAGESSVTVAVKPQFAASVTEDAELTMSILAGDDYEVGDPASATAKIVNSATSPYVRFVSTAGSDSDNDGLAPERPFATVRKAVEVLDGQLAAGGTEGIVYLAAGTYSEECDPQDFDAGVQSTYEKAGGTVVKCGWSCVNLTYPIRIVGQTGDPKDVTVKRKNNTGRVFFLNHAGATIENLTVTGGTQGWRTPDRWTVGVNGSNVFIAPNGGTVENCVISGGSVSLYGTYGGNVEVLGGRVVRSRITGGSGQVGALNASAGVVENSVFTGNSTSDGNGVVRLVGTATMVNCTVARNTGSAAAAGVYVSGQAKAVNVAVFENTATTDTTGHQHVWAGSADRFFNCAGEAAPNDTCVEAAAAGFADAAAGDFSIGATSPCRDKGSDYYASGAVSPTDYAGFTRVMGPAVDIGAYEFDSSALSVDFTWSVASGFIPFAVTLTALVEGAEGAVEYRWDVDGDGVCELTTDTPETIVQLTTAGARTITLQAVVGGQSATKTYPNCVVAEPKVMYVSSANQRAEYPYDTWERAASNLPEVVEHALDGTVIHVADGRYLMTGPITLDKAVRIVGTNANPRAAVVEMKGNEWDKRAFVMNHADAFVANLMVYKGYAQQDPKAGGIHFKTFGGTVSNCVVSSCGAYGYYPMAAGVYLENGLLTHSVIENCQYNSGGGGEAMRSAGAKANGTGRIENCLFKDFDAAGHDGSFILSVGGANAVVRNCTVVHSSVRPFLMNNESVNYTDVAAIGASAGLVENCVVFDVVKIDPKDASVTNGVAPWLGSADKFSHCATDGAAAINETCKLVDASAFKDYAHGDYTPVIGGALYNAGMTPEGWDKLVDLAGKSRVYGKVIDIGCYEAKPPSGIVLIFR